MQEKKEALSKKNNNSLLNRVLTIDFDKDSDEESLVIDPDDFSGGQHAPQLGSPGDVGSDKNVPQDIPAHLHHLPHVSCVPVLQETIDNTWKKLYVPWKSELVMDLTLYQDSEETPVAADAMQ